MVTTSLWHIKGRLGDLIDYVENPEKTVPKGTEDFFNVFEYVRRHSGGGQQPASGAYSAVRKSVCVHNNDKYDGHCHVKVDIYFSVIGMMDIPDEKEIQAMMDEVQKNPQKYRYVA